MTHSNYFKEFIRYTFLNILGMLALSFYILADTFFIARGIGINGLTALNLAIPVYSLINGCGLMLGMGGAIKYAIYKSRNDTFRQNAVFTNSIYMAIIPVLIFVLCGIFLPGAIARLLGADEATWAMTRTYLRVILLFSPAFILSNILNAFVRNDGDPKLAMLATTTGCLSNVFFDFIFIFPLQMGILGAVLATGFAPVINMLILSAHFRKGKNQFHLISLRPNLKLTTSTAMLGFPSLITELSSGIVIIVFNFVILKLQGNTGVAAYGVIANLSLVVSSIFTGIAQGMQPLTSRTHGSGDYTVVQKVRHYALTLMLLLSAIVYLFVFIFADPITAAFNSEHSRQLQQIATIGLKLYFVSTPFMDYNIIMAVFLASTERPVPAQIISLLRGLIIIIPMTILLSSLFGMTGVWLSCPASEGLVALIAMIILLTRTPHRKDEQTHAS